MSEQAARHPRALTASPQRLVWDSVPMDEPTSVLCLCLRTSGSNRLHDSSVDGREGRRGTLILYDRTNRTRQPGAAADVRFDLTRTSQGGKKETWALDFMTETARPAVKRAFRGRDRRRPEGEGRDFAPTLENLVPRSPHPHDWHLAYEGYASAASLDCVQGFNGKGPATTVCDSSRDAYARTTPLPEFGRNGFGMCMRDAETY